MNTEKIISEACEKYGVSQHDFNAKNAKRGTNSERLPVRARRWAAKRLHGLGFTLSDIARATGYSGPSPVRYLITGKR